MSQKTFDRLIFGSVIVWLFLMVLAAMFSGKAHGQTTGAAMPNVKVQIFDNNGKPAANYRLCTFLAGTTTQQATYKDSGLNTLNTNPIVLDSAGRADIFLSAVNYKFVLALPSTTSTCTTGVIWSEDNIGDIGQLLNLDLVSGTNTWGSTNTWTGAATFAAMHKMANVRFVDGIVFTTIQQALNDLPNTSNPNIGGTVYVPANYSETLAADIAITKDNTTIQFLGPAVIQMGAHEITVAQGLHNVRILGPLPWGGFPGPVLPGVALNYTGSAAAIQVGTNGTTLTQNVVIENLYLSLGSSGAGAKGINATYIQQFAFNNIRFNGSGTNANTCIAINGGSGDTQFSGLGIIDNPYCLMQSAGSIGIKNDTVGTGSVNSVLIKGGSILGGGGVSAIGLDFVAGGPLFSGTNRAYGVDLEGFVVGVSCVTNACYNNTLDIHFESNTTDAVFASGTQGNIVTGDDGTALNYLISVTDSGTNNTVWSHGKMTHGVLYTVDNIQQDKAAGNLYNVMNAVSGAADGTIYQSTGTPKWYVGRGSLTGSDDWEMGDASAVLRFKIDQSSGTVQANAGFGVDLVATSAITGPAPVKADTAHANQVVATTTSDTGAGIPIGVCANSPGNGGTCHVVTTGIQGLQLGTGTCSIGNFVIVDTTTNGRVQCTGSYSAGTVIGVALQAQTIVGNQFNVLIGLR